MNSDMGQQFILQGGKSTYEIRVYDISGNMYHGKSFSFTFPATCPGNKCGDNAAYEVKYLNYHHHFDGALE